MKGACSIAAREVVPGDIILLEAGNIIPADIRLSQAEQFAVNESSLTGESLATHKQTDVLSSSDLLPGDEDNWHSRELTLLSEERSLFHLCITSNRALLATVLLTFCLQLVIIYIPALNKIFKTQPLNLTELATCLLTAIVILLAVETEKGIRRLRKARTIRGRSV